jgi:hypothetical protein
LVAFCKMLLFSVLGRWSMVRGQRTVAPAPCSLLHAFSAFCFLLSLLSPSIYET